MSKNVENSLSRSVEEPFRNF